MVLSTTVLHGQRCYKALRETDLCPLWKTRYPTVYKGTLFHSRTLYQPWSKVEIKRDITVLRKKKMGEKWKKKYTSIDDPL